MKKILVLLALTMALVLCLAACVGESVHTHQYSEWDVTENPTCTEKGTKERYCSCGEKQTANIISNGHNYVNGVCTTCGHSNAGVAPDEDASTNNDDKIQVSAEEQKYNEALALLEAADYVSAHKLFKELGDYKDSKIHLSRFHNVVTSISESMSDWEYTIVCRYNDKNLPVEYTLSDTNPEYSELYTFSYDDNGNLLKELCTTSDGYSESYIYIYNENNDLIKTENVGSNGYNRTYYYTYDEKGNLIKEVITSSDGYNYTYDYTYYYDENENFVTERITTDSDGSRGTHIEIYNKKGNLIKEISIYPFGGKDTYDYAYRYDEKGNLLAISTTDEYGSTRTEYYDEYGNCIKSVHVDSDGNETIDDYSDNYTYYYDECGNLIKMVQKHKYADYIITYYYDKHDNLIKMVESDVDGYSFIMNYKLVYIPYDIAQNVIDVLAFTHLGS